MDSSHIMLLIYQKIHLVTMIVIIILLTFIIITVLAIINNAFIFSQIGFMEWIVFIPRTGETEKCLFEIVRSIRKSKC